jgi:antitoxin component of RelBE/YafQ-DinJ toxin-antitoxin module
MAKDMLNVRVDGEEIASLDAIATRRGITVSQLVRGIINRELAEAEEPVSLDLLFEARTEINQRIAAREADLIAELKNRKPPDLVIVEIGDGRGAGITVERSEAIKAGLPFKEQKTSKAKKGATSGVSD